MTLPIAISDMQDLPAIRKIPLLDVLCEGDGSITINRDIWRHVSTQFSRYKTVTTHGCRPIPRMVLEGNLNRNVGTYGNQVTELKVSGKAACLAGNAFHQATVTKERYSI
jgi:hypothetical protein